MRLLTPAVVASSKASRKPVPDKWAVGMFDFELFSRWLFS